MTALSTCSYICSMYTVFGYTWVRSVQYTSMPITQNGIVTACLADQGRSVVGLVAPEMNYFTPIYWHSNDQSQGPIPTLRPSVAWLEQFCHPEEKAGAIFMINWL